MLLSIPGQIVERTGRSREYKIRWTDGSETVHRSPLMFGSFTKQPKLEVNDRVLAVKDDVFLLGTVKELTTDSQLIIEYYDGSVRYLVVSHCFIQCELQLDNTIMQLDLFLEFHLSFVSLQSSLEKVKHWMTCWKRITECM